MQTELADFIRDTPAGKEAEEILRKCVHCGFCTATCPTYQLLGDELDGPRGRIYLIKQMLESGEASAKTRLHLDRCLTCRACETTCPSGVQYGRLLDIGRVVVDRKAPRHGSDALKRSLLKHFVPRAGLFGPAMKLGRLLRPLLPAVLRAKVPPAHAAGVRPPVRHRRRMLMLEGCVQPATAPNINAAAARVFDRIGISLVAADKAGCCGALRFHLGDVAGAQQEARRNIDAWWPLLEAEGEAVVMTASGCGVQVRDYAHLLQDDERYAAKAARVALLTRDVGEALAAESARLLPLLAAAGARRGKARLAFHAPCTLQHGQQIRGVVEQLLATAGFELTPVADSHLCCGSAGTYSLLQPQLATRLRDNKLAALGAGQPQGIASANIGCITHLQSGTQLPVRHWIELLDERMN
ncbi:MAG: glycolate oxidase subunit GlcF [Rhodocyclaceae bacterium]|nr:glycolate oxidase subunit GlcF [Rhodocyclaceae bacterium]